ncbi:MAG TPA: right-handed parallel beta-helix repeat-containing protein [Clostridia bacterium]|nr:right-handed parallel beta-helix repeat-containing protein [Clostridia bacterium]
MRPVLFLRRPSRCLACLALALTLTLALDAHSAVFHVAERHAAAADDAPGTLHQPWKTIARAATQAGPGDTVLVHGGVYRERVLIEKNGTATNPLRFEAAPGEHVVLTGADQLTGWTRHDPALPIYRIAWPHRFIGWSPQMTHPGDTYHQLIGRCEQVMVDGYALRQVLDAAQLSPGTFYVDITNKALLVWDIGNRDPNKTLVEGSVRQEILKVTGSHVRVRGMTFRYAANMAQHGAVVMAGGHGILEHCAVERMNASGATFLSTNLLVSHCVFRDNGQLGFGANGAHDLLFTGCLVENNNVKGFDRGWEAGGNKLVLCRNAVLERSRFLRNRGQGVWFDIGNEHCTVRNCLIAENEDGGIFYEISFGLQAHDNVIARNGFAVTPGAWGAQAGIVLSSSPNSVIERNLLVGNREGFNFREQTRTTPRIGHQQEIPVWNHDQVIRNNIIACNRDAQVWGWFDVADGRHWPAGTATNTSPGTAARPADIAAPYLAKPAQPQNLTLEDLHLSFSENIYFAAPGQGLIAWGTTWSRHQRYTTLAGFEALGIDQGSRVMDPGFADVTADDYRLPEAQMRQLERAYPRGEVPGVLLGRLPANTR